MRDLILVGFLLAFLAAGLRRPFLLVLLYCYVDLVTPQRQSYYLLNAVPVSLLAFLAAFGGWLMGPKQNARFSARQWLLIALLVYAALTTFVFAAFPAEARFKWDWVWKVLLWGGFVPLTLTSKLRVEAFMLTIVLCVGSIFISGGIKTLATGGGYGALEMLAGGNTGLYESSTAAMAAVATIPLILWLRRFGTIFPPGKAVTLFAAALGFACLLIPIGTQARTGLLCLGVLALLGLRDAKRRVLYGAAILLLAIAGAGFAPQSFLDRMGTIESHSSDRSATTRVAIWKWTVDYARDHPLGGGFDAYRANDLSFDIVNPATGRLERGTDTARAYHSAYFEMLGEQGYPGLLLWLTLHVSSLIAMSRLRRRYRADGTEDVWIRSLATALQNSHLIYLVGGLFVGIAYLPFVYLIIALEIGLTSFAGRGSRHDFAQLATKQRRLAPGAGRL